MPSSEQQAIVERCREAAQRFRPRAAHHDATGEFAAEDFADLRQAGLLGLMVPKEFGGLGADFLCYTLATEELARGHAATALNFTQHSLTVGSLAAFDTSRFRGTSLENLDTRRRQVLEDIAGKGRLLANATTEPGTGFRPSRVRTRYRSADDGYVLNGEKSFVSMAGHADCYLVAAASEEEDEPTVSFFLVEAASPGISVRNSWDTCGMRATASHDLLFRECFVPFHGLLAGIEGMAIPHLIRAPHWAVGAFNGVYLGICDEILDFTVRHLQGRTPAGEAHPLSHDPVIQHEVGKLSVMLEATRAVVYHAAELAARAPGSAEASAAVYRAKYLVGENAPQMASDAIRICGGNAIRKEHPLERHYRDARCAGLMSATSDVCLGYVGKAALGLDVLSVKESHW